MTLRWMRGSMILCLPLVVLSCHRDSSVDTTTCATPVIKAEKKQQPPPWPTYEVIGKIDGLRGFVIKYGPRLYRGGYIESERGLAALAERFEVKTIVTVTPDPKIASLAARRGIEYVAVTFGYDGITPDVVKKAEKVFTEGKGPFYVHCYGGSQRAGILCALYRVLVEKWGFEKAAVEWGVLGGKLQKNYGLLVSLKVASSFKPK